MFPTNLQQEARRLKLDTLVRLRWLAVTGQCFAVGFVHLELDYRMPFAASLAVIAASATLNLWLRIRRPASHRLGDDAVAGVLAFDILQLGTLLFLTGGLQNPFSILFLGPVLISAAALSPARTIALGLLAAACVTVLSRYHLKLPWKAGEPLAMPSLYVVGIWSSILISLGFTGAVAYRVAEEARQLGEALAATELVLAREQHLSQLDGLAAAAAHELGTPLATIRLVAKEIALQAEPGTPLAEDIGLLRAEVDRCRLILSKLTSLGQDDGAFLSRIGLDHLLEEVVSPHRNFDKAFEVVLDGEGPRPDCVRSPGLLYSLGNLVDNATDFAADTVTVEGRWTADTVTVTIRDDGPGYAPEVLLRVGEPYVTTRGGARGGDLEASGLGLGLFIAKTLIERSGGQLHLSNGPPSRPGAHATISWPREAFSRGVDDLKMTVSSESLSDRQLMPI